MIPTGKPIKNPGDSGTIAKTVLKTANSYDANLLIFRQPKMRVIPCATPTRPRINPSGASMEEGETIFSTPAVSLLPETCQAHVNSRNAETQDSRPGANRPNTAKP